MKLTIANIQETQRINLKQIQAMKPNGALGRAVQVMATEAQKYAVYITHVITGGLRASHRIALSGIRGEIYLDPSAVNPARNGARPSIYGLKEHERGGSHAFYARTESEAGERISRYGADVLENSL